MEERKKYYYHGTTSDGRRFTIASEVCHEYKMIYSGIALCGPDDNFNRKLGVKIASGRLNANRNHGTVNCNMTESNRNRVGKEQEMFTKYIITEYENVSSDELKAIFNLKKYPERK